MGEAFIVRRGGGGISSAYAVISVTYPAGSTCTCTKGSKTLRAKDTSGSYLFLIPESGTWTVSCTDGTDTASQNVVIDSQYQAENVELFYLLYLYRNGNQFVYVTGGWAIFNNQAVLNDDNIYCKQNGVGVYGYGNAHTSNMIDLTDFSTLNFKCRGSTTQDTADWRSAVGISKYNNVNTQSPDKWTSRVILPNDTVEHILTVDISAVTGEYYILATNGYIHGQYVYEVWCE